MFKKLLTLAFVLGCLLIGVSQVNPAQAAADTAKWYIHAYVDNGQLNVDWTVETGYVTSLQQWVVVNQSVTRLKCFTDGTPQISGNSIYFDGRSSVKCAVPSFQQEVKKLSGGTINLEPLLGTQSILAEVDGKIGFNSGANANPIFVMEENLSMNIPMRKGKGSMMLAYPSGQTDSGSFAVFGRNKFKIEENCGPTHCAFDHQLSGTPIVSDSAPFTINLPTDESTFVIGYSPSHKTYLTGEVFDLFVDPFTRGPGSG